MNRNGWRLSVSAMAIGVMVTARFARAQPDDCGPLWDVRIGNPGMRNADDNYGYVWSIKQFDDGAGPAVYAGGDFDLIGGEPGRHFARWDGSGWVEAGGGLNGKVLCMEVGMLAGRPVLFVGGQFTEAGGVSSNHIAAWDGTRWHALGQGTDDDVNTMCFVPTGPLGPALYAAGYFENAGGAACDHIARFGESGWEAMGAGIGAVAWAMATFDDGTGPSLYVTGSFRRAGDLTVDLIARWDGSQWQDVGGGLDYHWGGGCQDHGDALAVFDDGAGPALFVGGEFEGAAEIRSRGIVKWDGSAWSGVGGGFKDTDCGGVWDLKEGTWGGRNVLFAGGQSLLRDGSNDYFGVSVWDGLDWTAIGNSGGILHAVETIERASIRNQLALLAGGDLRWVEGKATERVASFGLGTSLLETSAFVRGQQATIRTRCMKPGYPVHFFTSTSGAGLPTFINEFVGTVLLENPHYLGTRTAQQSGVASIQGTIPATLPYDQVWVQAIQDLKQTNKLNVPIQ